MMELSEFMMKMLQIGMVIVAVVAVILQSTAFEGVVEEFTYKKVLIDFSQSVLSAPCLLKDVNNEFQKGMFDIEKLEVIDETDFCLEIDGDYYIEMIADSTTWTIGNEIIGGYTDLFPASFHDGENIIPGDIYVTVKIR
jgi:hypothetical protein